VGRGYLFPWDLRKEAWWNMATCLSSGSKLKWSAKFFVHLISISAIDSKFIALNVFSNFTLSFSKTGGPK
jgi:hypothetical protein